MCIDNVCPVTGSVSADLGSTYRLDVLPLFPYERSGRRRMGSVIDQVTTDSSTMRAFNS